jgi:membrane-associated phospholipid phosphatase
MLPFEGLVIAYLTFFAAVAPLASVERRRWMATALVAAVAAVTVYVASRTLPANVRLWLPFLYIPLGHWMPVPLVPSRRGGAFEGWLRRTDSARRALGRGMPASLTYAAEVGYLICFPLIPIAFAVVWIAGSPDDVARFWTAVLAAGYACYMTLPWLVSRPPRVVESDIVDTAFTPISRANVFVLGQVSHHLTTFPSGHVAVSVAAAISAGTVWPLAGAVLGLIAIGVAIGAVSGRHHYIADVLLGLAIGVTVNLV